MDNADLNINARALTLIAHKLRTPLSIINGYCEAIQAQSKTALSPFSVKALDEISIQGAHLSKLIDKLAAFNKVCSQAGEPLVKQEISLKTMIKASAEKVLSLEENLANDREQTADTVRRGAFVETDCPGHLTLKANEELMRLCLEELLENAIKFNSKTEKIIKIQCVHHGNCISISVRDYGVGIRSQDVGRIFEPFYQVDDDLTGQVSGWGLGLTMVKKILELHQGSVSVVSDRGLGSIFTINVPLL